MCQRFNGRGAEMVDHILFLYGIAEGVVLPQQEQGRNRTFSFRIDRAVLVGDQQVVFQRFPVCMKERFTDLPFLRF